MKVQLGFVAVLFVASSLHAQDSYKREIPDSLAKKARITEAAAASTAIARVPKGKIESAELEVENKKLVYSFDISVAGKKGIEEVQVSALTGKVVSVEHETPKQEKKEAAEEKKQKSAAKKP